MTFHTEVKIAEYHGDIEELVRRYSNEFINFEIFSPENKKYCLPLNEKGELYFLMVSQYSLPELDYNLVLSVNGVREERVQELMKELEERLGLETEEAPEDLKDGLRRLALISSMLFQEAQDFRSN
jgi:hypothetical protein